MLQILIEASYDSGKIVLVSAVLAIFCGMSLGLLLEITSNKHLLGKRYGLAHKLLKSCIDFLCNIPDLLLLIVLVLVINSIFAEYLSLQVSTSIAIGVIGMLCFGQQLFVCFHNLPQEFTETAKFLGANHLQIITKFLIPQILAQIIACIIQLLIRLINLSLLASIFGVEGLGKIALEQGLQLAELGYLLIITLVVMAWIYVVKFIGHVLVNFIEIKYNYHLSE